VFFDIGANYGLHSLLLAAHGVHTVSFEPNPTCHGFLKDACALNGIACEIEPLALDDSSGERDIWFPETMTWCGGLDRASVDEVHGEHPVHHLRVQALTLDEYVQRRGLQPDLIKIDAEGSELRILRGGLQTLRSARPLVIFESWEADRTGREELLRLFAQLGYRICDLPFPTGRALEAGQFLPSQRTNFLAAPNERL
jgi:FkbM family methyltransferase